MPIGMFGLGILLLVRDANGSFGVAGRVVGAFASRTRSARSRRGGSWTASASPRCCAARRRRTCSCSSRSSSRPGATRPSWVLALCALGAGAFLPQVPAAMRSLWSALVEDEDSRQTAYALVTIVFEVSVVTAPVARAAIAAVASPAAAVLTAAAVGASARSASR